MTTSLRNRGTWKTGETYQEFDQVLHRETLWVSKYPSAHYARYGNAPGSWEGETTYWIRLSEVLPLLPETDFVFPFRQGRQLRKWEPDERYFAKQAVFFGQQLYEAIERTEVGESPESHPDKWKYSAGSGGSNQTVKIPSAGSYVYEFKQEYPSENWNITHDLGNTRFNAEVMDSDGNRHLGFNVSIINESSLDLNFCYSIMGTARIWPLLPINKPLMESINTPNLLTVPILEFDIEEASESWRIEHNSGMTRFHVLVEDESGRPQSGFGYKAVDPDIMEISFACPMSGRVQLLPLNMLVG